MGLLWFCRDVSDPRGVGPELEDCVPSWVLGPRSRVGVMAARGAVTVGRRSVGLTDTFWEVGDKINFWFSYETFP